MKDDNYSNYSPETVIGWMEDDDYVSVDIACVRSNNRHIRTLDALVTQGKAELKSSDDEHRFYKVKKGVLNCFTVKHTRTVTDDEKARLAERMKKARASKSK